MDIKLTWILFIIFCNIFSYINCLVNGKYNGDFTNREILLNNKELFFILVLIIVTYIIYYKIFDFFYKKIENKKILKINKKIYMVMFFVLFIQAYIAFKFSYGTVWGIGEKINEKIVILSNRIPLNDGIPILFCLERENKTKSKLFWPLIILFLAYNFYIGWSSHILLILVLEVFLRVKKLNLKSIYQLRYIILLSFLSLPIIQYFRFKIRNFDTELDFFHSLNILFGRLSHFSNICVIYEMKDFFSYKVMSLIGRFHYIREISFAFIPARVQGIKNWITIQTLLFLEKNIPYNNDYSLVKTAYMPGFLGKCIILQGFSILDMICFIVANILLIYFLIRLGNLFGKEALYYIFYYCTLNIITESFLNIHSKILYSLVFWFFIIKILNVKIIRRKNVKRKFNKINDKDNKYIS